MQVEARKLDRSGVDPFHDLRRLVAFEASEQRARVALDHDHRTVHFAHEFLLDRAIQKLQQWIETTRDVEQPARLLMHPELPPGPDLEELLQRPDPAGKRDKSVSKLGHHRLALVHRINNAKIVERRIRYLALHQHARNHSDDVAQLVEHCLGERSHQSDTRSAIDDSDSALAKELAECTCSLDVIRTSAGIGSAENRETPDLAHVRGCIAAIMPTPNPTRDCPPSQTTTAPVMNFAASLDRKSARSAISSFVAKRPAGIACINCLRISGVGASRRIPSVSSTAPGAIELTRTPCGPHSMARHFVSKSTPAFAAQTCACKGIGVNACVAEMLIMEAPGRLRCSYTARHVLNVPSKSMSTTALNPFADIPSAGAGKLPAAPQTTRSISP